MDSFEARQGVFVMRLLRAIKRPSHCQCGGALCSHPSPLPTPSGRIQLGPIFHAPEVCTVTRFGSEPAIHGFKLPVTSDGERYNFRNGQGMGYEAQAVQRAILAGKLECEECPWAETLAVLRTMDEVSAAGWPSSERARRRGGVAFPSAQASFCNRHDG